MRIKATSNLIAAVMVILIALTMIAVLLTTHYQQQRLQVQADLLHAQQMLVLFRKGSDNLSYALRALPPPVTKSSARNIKPSWKSLNPEREPSKACRSSSYRVTSNN